MPSSGITRETLSKAYAEYIRITAASTGWEYDHKYGIVHPSGCIICLQYMSHVPDSASPNPDVDASFSQAEKRRDGPHDLAFLRGVREGRRLQRLDDGLLFQLLESTTQQRDDALDMVDDQNTLLCTVSTELARCTDELRSLRPSGEVKDSEAELEQMENIEEYPFITDVDLSELTSEDSLPSSPATSTSHLSWPASDEAHIQAVPPVLIPSYEGLDGDGCLDLSDSSDESSDSLCSPIDDLDHLLGGWDVDGIGASFSPQSLPSPSPSAQRLSSLTLSPYPKAPLADSSASHAVTSFTEDVETYVLPASTFEAPSPDGDLPPPLPDHDRDAQPMSEEVDDERFSSDPPTSLEIDLIQEQDVVVPKSPRENIEGVSPPDYFSDTAPMDVAVPSPHGTSYASSPAFTSLAPALHPLSIVIPAPLPSPPLRSPKSIRDMKTLMVAAHQPGNDAALAKVKSVCAQAHLTRRESRTDMHRFVLAVWRAPNPVGGTPPSFKEASWSSPNEIFVDASTSWGIGFIWKGNWMAWKLKDGWRRDGRDITWAEMTAVELGLRTILASGYSSPQIIIRSDNTGVVQSLTAGTSKNSLLDDVVQTILRLAQRSKLGMTLKWISTKDNPADDPSRGIFPSASSLLRQSPAAIPAHLSDFIDPPIALGDTGRANCALFLT